MMIRALILAAFLASAAAAQATKPADPYQQAYQRLLQRQTERAASATQPANITNAELDALKKKIGDLERQVRELLDQNTALRATIEKSHAAIGAQNRPGPGEKPSWSEKVKIGMTFQEVRNVIGFDPHHTTTNADGEKIITWAVGPALNPIRSITITFKSDKVVDFTEDK